MSETTDSNEAYAWLVDLLEREGAEYRLIDHPPEGRTDVVSPMRGHDTKEAAKCIILMVKIGRKETRFVLAVVPGDARVDLGKIKDMFRGTFIRFAEQSVAEELGGSVAGTILPFARSAKLTTIVDPALTELETIYFNAARLDRSVGLRTADFLRIAKPRLERIALH